MGMSAPVYYTADMVRALPDDGRRYEVVRGELLVSPAPRPWHQEVVWRLARALDEYLQRNRVGHLFFSPADISWGSHDTLVQPDLFVVPLEEARTMSWDAMRTLLLVIETLSPTTRRADRFTKRSEYQRRQVPVYWIVDPENERVEVWVPDAEFPKLESERVTWLPAGAAEPFVMDLRELFRPL